MNSEVNDADDVANEPPWLEGVEGDDLPRLILSDAPVIRVISGPGSGKTRGLRSRVQRLIQKDAVDPSRIYVGTFTRAITRDLTESLGDLTSDEMQVSTLHSLAYRLLRENPTALKGRSLRILMNFETWPMLYDIGTVLNDDSDQNTRRKTLRRIEAETARRREYSDSLFFGALDRWLRSHKGMLIDEVVSFATQALENEDIAPGMFDHVLIDEYQDLTDCEQSLIELLWSRNGSLVVLGDDDQKIYGFRYNSDGGITAFDERWDEGRLEDITIPDNRRSGPDIVVAANTMMAEAGPTKAPMDSKRPEEGTIIRVPWPSIEEEIDGIADYIKARSESEFLVLVPLRFMGYRLQEAIGPEARTSFNEGLLEHRIACERFTLASLIANPEDRIALRTWLAFNKDGSDWATKGNTESYGNAIESGLAGSVLAAAVANLEIELRGAGKGLLVTRAQKLKELSSLAPDKLEDLINFIFDPDQAFVVGDVEKRRWAAKDIESLRFAAQEILAKNESITELTGVMDNLKFRIASREPVEAEGEYRVNITTLHSAKGLQAENVIILGLADEILPGKTESEEDREERRRLLYVAVTRARTELIVSWPRDIGYGIAMQSNIRIEKGATHKVGPNLRVRLGKSSLISPDFPGDIISGSDFLSGVT